MLIYRNFNFDFLALDNVYFENYFVNKHVISFVFKLFKTLTARALSEYKTLDYVSYFSSKKNTFVRWHNTSHGAFKNVPCIAMCLTPKTCSE